MGTAGPLALARDILWNDQNIPFFVLNRWVGGGWSRGLKTGGSGALLVVWG